MGRLLLLQKAFICVTDIFISIPLCVYAYIHRALCLSFKDVYWRNPQYIIDLEHCTDYTWTVISLTEVMPKERENSDIYIGFDIYKVGPLPYFLTLEV